MQLYGPEKTRKVNQWRQLLSFFILCLYTCIYGAFLHFRLAWTVLLTLYFQIKYIYIQKTHLLETSTSCVSLSCFLSTIPFLFFFSFFFWWWWWCRWGRILESPPLSAVFYSNVLISCHFLLYQPKKRCRSPKIKWWGKKPLLFCPCLRPVSYRMHKQCKQKQPNCTIRLTLCFHTDNCPSLYRK